jgi:hypothetical protein
MAGQRHQVDSIGESYELFAESVLSRIAVLTRVGTKSDFGTDTYCQPRISTGNRMETVTELCLLQVKGGTSPLEYGGMEKETGKEHEFNWLKSLWAPLFLATVDAQYQQVDLYSLWQIWWVMWQCGTPFRVICTWRDAVTSAYDYSPAAREPASGQGATHGDGHIWRIDLGPPFLRLTHQNLNDPAFRSRAVDIFRSWIRVDRQTVARFHSGVPFVEAHYSWITNEMPGAHQQLLTMSSTPGMNIPELARSLAPSVLGLGAHLQHQGNVAAFRLIPILEWLQENGFGNLMTGGLLEKLTRSRDEGVPPNTYL